MPRTVDIPGGQATLRTPDEIRERQRRLITSASMAAAHIFAKVPPEMQAEFQRVISEGPVSQDDLQVIAMKYGTRLRLTADDTILLTQIQDAAIKAFLVSWTIGDPLPNEVADVPDMRKDVYDALAEATAADAKEIAESNFSPSPRPDGRPTGGSTLSGGPSTDKPSLSTMTPASVTAPTAGGGSSPA